MGVGVFVWSWLLWSGILLVLVLGFAKLREVRRQERERRVLEQKYGDLPMFDEFFKRLRDERQSKGRAS